MRLTTLLLLLIFASCADNTNKIDSEECDYIKNYYPNIYKAEVSYQIQNYKAANFYYEKAFSNCDPVNTTTFDEVFKMAMVQLKLGNQDRALDFVEKDIEIGNSLTPYLTDSNFKQVFTTDRGRKIVVGFNTKRKKYIDGINMELRTEFVDMANAINIYRQMSPQEREMDTVSGINLKRLKRIFDKYGYPDKTIIGDNSIEKIFIEPAFIVQLASDSLRKNFYIPILTKATKDGKLSPYFLASVEDRYLAETNQDTKYGTIKYKGYNPGAIDPQLLDKLNKNRVEIGLPKLEKQYMLDNLKK